METRRTALCDLIATTLCAKCKSFALCCSFAYASAYTSHIHAKDFVMIRMHLASASLLAIAISLAGCGEDKATVSQTPAPAASSANAPAAATSQIDEAAAAAVVGHYADLALAVFSDAASTGKALQGAIDALLANPTDATLQAAREAWLAARAPYMQSEVFRFGNAVGATANIIANTQIQVGEDQLDVTTITPELLASLNELGGSEANVATGYHAIEFMLWGQDLNGSNPGAGARPATDFVVGEGATGGNNERRRAFLKAAGELLVSDLDAMVVQWQAGNADNYRASLQAESAENGLRKMLFGMG